MTPDCPGRLEARPSLRPVTLDCDTCGAIAPVLAGVPVLVPAVGEYLATYRESLIATLAEHDAVSPGTLELLDAFAGPLGRVEPMRFDDDWLAWEAGGEEHPPPLPSGSAAAERFAELVAEAHRSGPEQALLDGLGPARLGLTLEIGPGAGRLSQELQRRADHLIVCDFSLRAVLTSLRAAEGEEASQRSPAGLVADAHELPLRDETAATVVAANLIDLLDEPQAFLDEVVAVLQPGGRLAISTPRPDLGLPVAGDDQLARSLLARGLQILSRTDGVPWVRAHGPRDLQVYFVQCIVALKPDE